MIRVIQLQQMFHRACALLCRPLEIICLRRRQGDSRAAVVVAGVGGDIGCGIRGPAREDSGEGEGDLEHCVEWRAPLSSRGGVAWCDLRGLVSWVYWVSLAKSHYYRCTEYSVC